MSDHMEGDLERFRKHPETPFFFFLVKDIYTGYLETGIPSAVLPECMCWGGG